MSKLPEWIEVGQSFRIDYGPGNYANAKYHIRGIVDDQVVTRRWRQSKQRWEYECLDHIWFAVSKEHIKR